MASPKAAAIAAGTVTVTRYLPFSRWITSEFCAEYPLNLQQVSVPARFATSTRQFSTELLGIFGIQA
uniref:Uncharacterized protein n=1 Tax=Rhizophagus irregularis (strain DAOM 181602 / DAOM 197198 / MUCL 43194) TaxID=747089 RepID=U9T6U1_RHIID